MDERRGGFGPIFSKRMERPLVSVYLPTRDRPVLAERAIRSVFTQTYPNIQLVVVDDASAADTLRMLLRLKAECGSRLDMEIIRQSMSQGACRARNLALAACAGDYVTGLDDDDYFLPERISSLVDAFDASACSFVFDGYIRETTRPDGRTGRVAIRLRRPATLPDLLRRNIVGNQILTLAARLRDVGGFDERLPAWQDYDLWIRLARTFGPGKPAGGCSYVNTVDARRSRISHDTGRIEQAFAIFLEKHAEYADPQLDLCLRLAKACYGLDALSPADIPALLRLGEPRYMAFSFYSYLATRWSRRSR